jgi:hypothetical protein
MGRFLASRHCSLTGWRDEVFFGHGAKASPAISGRDLTTTPRDTPKSHRFSCDRFSICPFPDRQILAPDDTPKSPGFRSISGLSPVTCKSCRFNPPTFGGKAGLDEKINIFIAFPLKRVIVAHIPKGNVLCKRVKMARGPAATSRPPVLVCEIGAVLSWSAATNGVNFTHFQPPLSFAPSGLPAL